MDLNFSDQLKTVLSDSDAMATIAQLAKRFSEKNGSGEKNISEEGTRTEERKENYGRREEKSGLGELLKQPAISGALRCLEEGSRERVALLQAMKPFVKEEKREKLERIIQTLKTLDLLCSAQKLL